MKIAVAAQGPDLTSTACPQFGRAPMFVIHDTETGATTTVTNTQSLNAAQGAGIQAAETVARSGAEAVIVTHCGPKAFRVLRAAGIAVHHCAAATVGEALEQFSLGRLEVAQAADVEGHWA